MFLILNIIIMVEFYWSLNVAQPLDVFQLFFWKLRIEVSYIGFALSMIIFYLHFRNMERIVSCFYRFIAIWFLHCLWLSVLKDERVFFAYNWWWFVEFKITIIIFINSFHPFIPFVRYCVYISISILVRVGVRFFISPQSWRLFQVLWWHLNSWSSKFSRNWS